MRSHRATHNLIAVSAHAKETAINVEQTLDTSLLVDVGTVINLTPRRESNVDELNGKEEADHIYELGGVAEASFSFPKAQPQHYAFLLAYGLGKCASSAAGGGYLHAITPIPGDLDIRRSNPTFTAAQRFGKTVLKRRFASMCVDQVTANFSKDSWCTVSGTIKGTGKHADNVAEVEITATADATTLTLPVAVHGADAAERLDNIQRVRVQLASGVWTEVVVTAAAAEELTIEAPGAEVTAVTYRVLYVQTEAGWGTFPGRVVESPLRVAQISVVLGGAWDGSAFQGGRQIGPDVSSIEYTLANNMAVEFVPGAGGDYATRAWRDGRNQTLKLNREMRETMLQRYMQAGEYFGVHILAEGAEYEAGHKYTVEMIFPRCGILNAPISVDGKRLAEAGDLQVLEHDTYGSALVRVKNLVAAYAA